MQKRLEKGKKNASWGSWRTSPKPCCAPVGGAGPGREAEGKAAGGGSGCSFIFFSRRWQSGGDRRVSEPAGDGDTVNMGLVGSGGTGAGLAIRARVMFVRGVTDHNLGALMFGLPPESAPGRSGGEAGGVLRRSEEPGRSRRGRAASCQRCGDPGLGGRCCLTPQWLCHGQCRAAPMGLG